VLVAGEPKWEKIMTITDHAGRPVEHPSVTKLSVVGAICYALWGCLHLQAAYAAASTTATISTMKPRSVR
jgi:hypothetical protein